METLKLEQIKLYPFGLKCRAKSSNKIFTINGMFSSKKPDYYGIQVEEQLAFLDIKDIALILHPLSDLTKPIQHNGEEFVPEYKMWEASENKDFIIKLAPSGAVHNETPYWAFQKLIEWKFNVFNLPPHLWIDVNTLEENPYK